MATDHPFAQHLQSLLSLSHELTGTSQPVLDQWDLISNDIGSQEGNASEDDSVKWPSLLNFMGATGNVSGYHPLVARLLQKLHAYSILNGLTDVLLSKKSNDTIAEELTELVGFDDIELVMDILCERETVSQQLQTIMDFKSEHPDLSHDASRLRLENTLQKNASRPLFSGFARPVPEALPHVYSSASVTAQGNVLSEFGSRYLLPIGTIRTAHEEYDEVIIPPARPIPPRQTEHLVYVDELDTLAKGCFPGYRSLNRIQSAVYPTAYGSNENLLICAPTGAGKTDVAMLTILRVIDQHRVKPPPDSPPAIARDSFKIIYVAPMKALASEIVRKLGKRLNWLSIKVRELTGDMQLTKAEIAETQIIVTTPEKWDVVTRKPTGEGELISSLRLLIIDEVHLLNEERGAIIETIVARTLRQVESSQSLIRIVGLSATLPNYLDVADFLSVSRQTGLFYFDSSFRPIPLEQHFLGIKGKPGSAQSKKNLDYVTYQKVVELINRGHQVMVFVHARKETVKTAMALRDMATLQGDIDNFSCEDHPQWNFFRRNIGESKNKEMKLLFDNGFGIHHAGMLRSDRNLMERLFEARAIKVLCCTATLAWGVNLPAHAVIIKGTQVYDTAKGAFSDLSVLDVLQVFGRAGRPGLEESGEGYICTTEDKLAHYLEAIISQHPIESQFESGLVDSLNAEIGLGTVANVSDGVQWLGYTYLFVRMQKNPFVYGLSRDLLVDDPRLGGKRHELITIAAKKLSNARMINLNLDTGAFVITDLGRIASKYYIRHSSIEIFNKEFRHKMTEADVLRMLCMSTEFGQIQLRESETKELEQLHSRVPCDVPGGPDTAQGKVNILLQACISREQVNDFALISDMTYVAQNSGRIVRALLEIAISRKWAYVAAVLMGLSKAIEKRIWPFDHPRKQFDLKNEIIYSLQEHADDWTVADLVTQSASDLGRLIHLNEYHGKALLDAAKRFPSLHVEYKLRPLGHDILKIIVRVERTFIWHHKTHGNTEPFWLWVEDEQGLSILQLSHLTFHENINALNIEFLISIDEHALPSSLTLRYVSDRWLGAEDEIAISLKSLLMPDPPAGPTPILDLPYLTIPHVANLELKRIGITHLNAIQTQIYWKLTQTRCHSLLCAPAASGKSTMARLILWTTLQSSNDCWAIIIVPRRSLASEMISALAPYARLGGISIIHEVGSQGLQRPRGKAIQVLTTVQLLQQVSDFDGLTTISGLDLVVCDDLQLLDATYELSLSILRHCTQSQPTRYVGFSDCIHNPADLASWLRVDELGLHNFSPQTREQALEFSVQCFTIPQSAAMFKAMIKPAHTAIQSSTGQSAIIFVPSRKQCHGIALDLITRCTLEMETENGYLPEIDTDVFRHHLSRLSDKRLQDYVSKGVGFFHEGISVSDRALMLELYVEGIIQVLIVPRTSAWTLPVRAGVVIVMGTQYFIQEGDGRSRQLRDYPITDIIRMQSRAIRHFRAGRFYIFCQAEVKDTIIRFINEGLPLESQLLEKEHLAAWYRKHRPRIEPQDVVDLLSHTFLARRLAHNPVFYDMPTGSQDESLSRIADRIIAMVSDSAMKQ